jgi:hypothetical protein
MKLSTYAIIVTILTAGYGLAFIFIPVKLMAFYAIPLDNSGILMARYLGVTNLFLAMIFWSYSSVSPAAKSWPKLLVYSIIYDIMLLAVTVCSLLSGFGNSNGWGNVALFVLLTIGSCTTWEYAKKQGRLFDSTLPLTPHLY